VREFMMRKGLLLLLSLAAEASLLFQRIFKLNCRPKPSSTRRIYIPIHEGTFLVAGVLHLLVHRFDPLPALRLLLLAARGRLLRIQPARAGHRRQEHLLPRERHLNKSPTLMGHDGVRVQEEPRVSRCVTFALSSFFVYRLENLSFRELVHGQLGGRRLLPGYQESLARLLGNFTFNVFLHFFTFLSSRRHKCLPISAESPSRRPARRQSHPREVGHAQEAQKVQDVGERLQPRQLLAEDRRHR